MFCKKCGNELKDGAKFCVKCGEPVTNPPQENQDKTEILTQPVPGASSFETSPINTVPSGPQGKIQPFSENGKKEKSNGKLLPIMTLLFIALTLVVVIVIFVFLFGKGKNKEDGQTFGGHRDKVTEQEEEAKKEPEKPVQKEFTGVKKSVNIEVRQVDTSQFPEITLYASVTDSEGETVEALDREDFNVREIDKNGNVTDASLREVYQVLNQDKISVNLVLDASGSMDSYSKMQQAKNAAISLVDQMNLDKGDQVEVISFDSYVYLEQDFSSQGQEIKDAINGIATNGSTALYDALYAGLFQTYYEHGAKCVIGFTDGMENASSYTFDDVVNMAQNTGIPVFIIGIGEEYDAAALQSLASQCSGKYYSANVNDLQSILEDIYISIYHEQQDYYVFKYTTTNQDNPTEFRDVVVETSETAEITGSYQKAYIPQADITGAFSSSYMDLDFILDFSSQRAVTESDLAGLSLAELRIARNEIFARHGRQFKDSMLNQWFYSKTWYLNLPVKYSPTDFDAISPSPLSRLESDNANFIITYENMIMDNRDIFPDAGNTLLSDYDLALSKAVLTRALGQMNAYPPTTVLEENKRRVQEAIDKEEIQY